MPLPVVLGHVSKLLDQYLLIGDNLDAGRGRDETDETMEGLTAHSQNIGTHRIDLLGELLHQVVPLWVSELVGLNTSTLDGHARLEGCSGRGASRTLGVGRPKVDAFGTQSVQVWRSDLQLALVLTVTLLDKPHAVKALLVCNDKEQIR